MKRKILFVAAVIFSSQLLAQQDSTRDLDQVIITANKYPQKQSATGKVLTVVDRSQLEQNAGRTLAQVLNEQAGLIINGAQNPVGANPTVFLRGAGAAYTLILVNGVPANDASGISGEFDLNQFDINQVERVEILKGSQSVLYGSDALAGVINIITRKPTGDKTAGINAVVSGGSYGTLKGNLGLSGKVKALSYDLRYSRLQSDGFSSAKDLAGNKNFDNDGFKQDAAGINVKLQATKNWQLSLFGQAAKHKTDLDDGAFTDDNNSKAENSNLQTGLSSLYSFSKGTLTVNLNLNHIKRTLHDEKNLPADPNDFDPFEGLYKSRTYFAEAFTNLHLHDKVGLLVGADFREQQADIETSYGNLGKDSLQSRQVSGYASFYLKSLAGFNAELGSRLTHHSDFGDAVTYSFTPSYIIDRRVKLFANIASGFKAPSLYNLASEYGNKELEPERSLSYEGGIQYTSIKNNVNVRFTYFDRTINDVIVFASLFAPPYGQYQNADKQKANGFELEATFRPGSRWNITANYAFVDGNVLTKSSSTGKDTSMFNLFRRPKNTFNTTIGFELFKKVSTSIGFRWVDKRDDVYFNSGTFSNEPVTLNAYYNLDFYVAYQPMPAVKIFADLRNITSQDYVELYGYNARKFNLMAGAIFNF